MTLNVHPYIQRILETLKVYMTSALAWKHARPDAPLVECLLETRKEGNVLFNDALNTFYLRLYGIRHMVKDHSDSEKGNPLPPHRLLSD